MNVKCRFVAVCLSLGLATFAVAASKQPPKKLTRDSQVPAVELFDAVEQGLVETTVIAKNSHEATVFVTNKSDAAVNVQFPKAIAAVQVLQQRGFAQRNVGMGPGGNNGVGGGQAQSIGGGAQQGNMGNQNGPGGAMFNNPGGGFQNGNGNGVFSVPPEKTIQVPLTTVCLAHGKPEPRARLKYQLVKLEDYSNDPVLQETLKLFVSGAADVETAQAAVWHLTDKLTWDDLRAKQIDRLSLDPVPYFGEGKVDSARDLIKQAQDKAKEKPRTVETAGRRPE